jgi:hypothetical protein
MANLLIPFAELYTQTKPITAHQMKPKTPLAKPRGLEFLKWVTSLVGTRASEKTSGPIAIVHLRRKMLPG